MTRFGQYSQPVATGSDWIPSLPKHWNLKRLKHVAYAKNSNVDKHAKEGETPIYLCNYTDVYYNERINSGLTFMEATASEVEVKKFRLHSGDILITKDSEDPEDIGVPALVSENMPNVLCGYHLTILRSKGAHLPEFLFRVIQAEPSRCQFSVGAAGITRYGLGQESIRNLRVPVPPLNEQRQIAQFLDCQTAKIDRLIEKQKQLVELFKEKIISEVDRASSLKEARKTRISEAARLVNRPVKIKEDETYTPLGLYNWGRGVFHKDSCLGEHLGESDFFWVSEGDLIISGQFAWEGAIAPAWKYEEGCVVSHRFPIIRGKSGKAETLFLYALFLTKYGRFLLNENSRGAAGRNRPLNINSLFKEKVRMPPLVEQQKISHLVEQKENLATAVEKQTMLLVEHRSSLISKVVTGQIDVRDWQPPETEPGDSNLVEAFNG